MSEAPLHTPGTVFQTHGPTHGAKEAPTRTRVPSRGAMRTRQWTRPHSRPSSKRVRGGRVIIDTLSRRTCLHRHTVAALVVVVLDGRGGLCARVQEEG